MKRLLLALLVTLSLSTAAVAARPGGSTGPGIEPVSGGFRVKAGIQQTATVNQGWKIGGRDVRANSRSERYTLDGNTALIRQRERIRYADGTKGTRDKYFSAPVTPGVQLQNAPRTPITYKAYWSGYHKVVNAIPGKITK